MFRIFLHLSLYASVYYSQGAFVGSATALSFMTWLCISAQHAITTGELKFDTKNVSTLGCTYHFIPDEAMSMLGINETASMPISPSSTTTEMETTGFQIYHISYLWYTLVGSSMCIIVSLITSYITGPNDPAALNPKLLAPFVRKLIKSSRQQQQRRSVGGIKTCGEDESIL
jgi:sodium-coupled monocarboxylate transporter 8/12